MLTVDEAHYAKNPAALRTKAVHAWAKPPAGWSSSPVPRWRTGSRSSATWSATCARTSPSTVKDVDGCPGAPASAAPSPRSTCAATRTTCSTNCRRASRPATGWTWTARPWSLTGRRSPRATSWRCAAPPSPPDTAGSTRAQSCVACSISPKRRPRTAARSWSSRSSAMCSHGRGHSAKGDRPDHRRRPARGGRPSSTSSPPAPALGPGRQIQAGGVGLNIQAASVVIICEPQWNPAIEEQAIARAHRMGQVRRVDVHRLLAETGSTSKCWT